MPDRVTGVQVVHGEREQAGGDETGYRNKGERGREQGGDREGQGQEDEQEVDGARRRKNTVWPRLCYQGVVLHLQGTL